MLDNTAFLAPNFGTYDFPSFRAVTDSVLVVGIVVTESKRQEVTTSDGHC